MVFLLGLLPVKFLFGYVRKATVFFLVCRPPKSIGFLVNVCTGLASAMSYSSTVDARVVAFFSDCHWPRVCVGRHGRQWDLSLQY